MPFVTVLRFPIAVASLAMERGLYGTQAAAVVVLGLESSVAAVHGLGCSVVCAVFSSQGSNPCFHHWQSDS